MYLKPPFNMKRHCSCGIFKSRDAVCFLLMQIVQLRDEAEGKGGMQSCSELQRCRFTVCRTLCFAIWSQRLADSALVTIFSCINIECTIGGSLYDYNHCMMCRFLFLFSLHSARGQPGADPHFCSRTHSSQTHHSLRSEILQKFPWGNVRIHSFSRWGCIWIKLDDFNSNLCKDSVNIYLFEWVFF